MESPVCPPTEPDFRLIETLAFRPEQGFVRLQRHLARMTRSADALGLPFDSDLAIQALNTVSGNDPLRCRLTLDRAGLYEVTTGPLAENPSVWRLGISDVQLDSSDPWLRYKTTRRAIYDRARASLPDDMDELLFLNEKEELCEGSITNLFLEMQDARWLTPPLSSGLLPGILREELLETEKVTEATLTLTDLHEAKNVHMGNSLRGLIRVELAIK